MDHPDDPSPLGPAGQEDSAQTRMAWTRAAEPLRPRTDATSAASIRPGPWSVLRSRRRLVGTRTEQARAVWSVRHSRVQTLHPHPPRRAIPPRPDCRGVEDTWRPCSGADAKCAAAFAVAGVGASLPLLPVPLLLGTGPASPALCTRPSLHAISSIGHVNCIGAPAGRPECELARQAPASPDQPTTSAGLSQQATYPLQQTAAPRHMSWLGGGAAAGPDC